MDRQSLHARVSARVAALSVGLALFGSLASFYAPATLLSTASGAAWTVDTTTRSESDVRAVWSTLKPVYVGAPYAVTPSVVAPYAPGDAAAGFRADGINTINFARYLSGLPYDVTLNATRNLDAQYGAVLLKTSATLTHTPVRPADMDQAFYDRGYASTSSSNIGSGYSTSYSFQKACLDDGDAGNIDRIGHRRWLLNPQMLYTGIGYAELRHTTYAFDRSRPLADVSYDFIAWPSAGFFPIEFANRSTPWSITLNPARYDWDATRTGHTVTLRRVADGKTWTMDAADTNTSGEYFNANFDGYGVSNAFIFRPNPADLPAGYAAGEQYDVTLSGGIYAEGTKTPVTVTYRTAFMTLADSTTPPAPPVTPAPPTPSAMWIYRFFNKSNGSHFYTASESERNDVIAKYAAIYRYEGPAYAINTANPANNVPLYRFFNMSNGSHFYTTSVAERDNVINTMQRVYRFEGVAFYLGS